MDRDGFNLIDRQYQLELAEATREITEKLNLEFQADVYVGTRQIQNEAKKKQEAVLQQRIEEAVAERANILGRLHFGDSGRDAVLAEIEKNELKDQRTQLIKGQFVSNKRDIEKNNGRE